MNSFSEFCDTGEEITQMQQKFRQIRAEAAKVVVRGDEAISALLIGLLTGGHVLLEGVPGTAKTLLVKTLARVINLNFARVQFTPDLMPGDLTGSVIYRSGEARFEFRKGPVFTNLLLADEINRTPPKTQAALLEAMAESQVTADGKCFPLEKPFMVAATQNPIEYEGTYNLPEAQLDRFLLKVEIPLPARETESELLRRHATGFRPADLSGVNLNSVADAQDVLRAAEEVRDVEIHESLLDYIVEIVMATRTSGSLELGVSPRGTVCMLQAARARAWLDGRSYVLPDDIKILAPSVLMHRLIPGTEAELDGLTARSILDGILNTVPVPR